jgi:hypothetical protein
VNVDPRSWTTGDFIPRVAPLDLDDCRLFAFVSDRMHGSRRAVDRQAVRITAFIREAQVHLARERPTWALRIDVQDIVVKPRRTCEGNTVDTPPVIGLDARAQVRVAIDFYRLFGLQTNIRLGLTVLPGIPLEVSVDLGIRRGGDR